MECYDVVIAGGGAGGSAAALTLLDGGVERVAIVEPSDMAGMRIGETIPPDANPLLTKLGVFDAFLAQDHLPCHGSASAWGDAVLGYNDFLVNPYGHGWHLDRARFDRGLLAAAEARGAIVLRDEVVQAEQGTGGVRLKLRGGASVDSGIVVDATGQAAVIARGFGARKQFEDRLVVISAVFRLDPGSEIGRATWLEGAGDGWWYACRLPGERAVVAFGTDPKIAKAAGYYETRGWLEGLARTDHLAGLLIGARLEGLDLTVVNAHSYRLNRVAGPGWVAVGDASMAFDPLSSAGIMKALMGGRKAGLAIADGRGFESYEADAGKDWAAYLGMRAQLYEAEDRWPEAAFWKGRRGLVAEAV